MPMGVGLGLGLSDRQLVGQIVARGRPGDTSTLGATTFTRADATQCATYEDVNVLVQTVAANVLRDLHYVGTTRTMLLESSAISIPLYSEQFDFAGVGGWIPGASGGGSVPVVTANQGVAPDGNATADKIVLVAPASGDNSELTQGFVVVSGQTYTGRVWVKAFAAGDIGKKILYRQVAGSAYTELTLTAAWQRLGATELSPGVNRSASLSLRPVIGGGSAGTVTVLAWGHDLKLGAFASSYIATDTVPVTRAVDALSYAGVAGTGAATLFYRYWDLATQAWVNLAAAYTFGNPIVPAIARAYADIVVLNGTLTTNQAAALLGY